MKTYGGVEVGLPFLTSALLDRGEWSASRSCHFTRRGKSPWYPLDRRLSGPQNQSGLCGEETNLDPAGKQTPAVHPVSPSLYRLSYPDSKDSWEEVKSAGKRRSWWVRKVTLYEQMDCSIPGRDSPQRYVQFPIRHVWDGFVLTSEVGWS
jgi:hypothetical protein